MIKLKEVKAIEGKIIKNISNTYVVSSREKEYEAIARGKLKISELKLVVRR